MVIVFTIVTIVDHSHFHWSSRCFQSFSCLPYMEKKKTAGDNYRILDWIYDDIELVGGFKGFLFSPRPREDSHFD